MKPQNSTIWIDDSGWGYTYDQRDSYVFVNNTEPFLHRNKCRSQAFKLTSLFYSCDFILNLQSKR